MTEPVRLALIDDDGAVLDALRLYFERRGYAVACFAAAEPFLAALGRGERFGCIVADVRMPGMSGLDLVRQLGSAGGGRTGAPVLLITGHGDVDMAVAAIKAGAFDFIEKPFDEARLLAGIENALASVREKEAVAAGLSDLRARFEALSLRQRQVMKLASAGYFNKEIASRLDISPKTVENHRAWVMERMGARNLAELVRMAVHLQAQE